VGRDFDIGADTGTPVDDKDYQMPFTFTGTLAKLTLKLEPRQLTPDEEQRLLQESRRSNRASE
jgi:arylsulfatase